MEVGLPSPTMTSRETFTPYHLQSPAFQTRSLHSQGEDVIYLLGEAAQPLQGNQLLSCTQFLICNTRASPGPEASRSSHRNGHGGGSEGWSPSHLEELSRCMGSAYSQLPGLALPWHGALTA